MAAKQTKKGKTTTRRPQGQKVVKTEDTVGTDAGRRKGERRAAGVTTTLQPAGSAPAAMAQVPGTSRPNSIRQTIISALKQGMETEAIAEMVKEKFPNSKAAAKTGKHISYYRSVLNRESRTVKA